MTSVGTAEKTSDIPSKVAQRTTETHAFFHISLKKLAIMCVLTAGLYDIYWFYKHWQVVKKAEQSNINILLRAVLGLFFAYALFQKMKLQHAGMLATAYAVLFLALYIPGFFWLIGFLSFIPLVIVQSRINATYDTPAPGTYNKIERFAAVVGGIIVVLAVIGTFIPE